MSDSPGVSIVIPVFNGERFLAQAIESILQQHWSPLEIIVVDDGSTDRSAEIAEGYRGTVKCIRQSHAGLPATRNVGFASAEHSYLLPFDSDDLMCSDAIATRMDYLKKHPECEILVGYFKSFGDFDSDECETEKYVVPEDPQKGHVAGTSLIHRSVFDRIGGFNERLQTISDLEWFVRCQEAGINIQEIEDVLMRRRIHGRNHSLSGDQHSSAVQLRMLKSFLDRKRERATKDLK